MRSFFKNNKFTLVSTSALFFVAAFTFAIFCFGSLNNQNNASGACCAYAADESQNRDYPIVEIDTESDALSLDELKARVKKIGADQGSSDAYVAQQEFGDTCEFSYFLTAVDMFEALNNDKVDTMCAAYQYMYPSLDTYPQFKCVKEKILGGYIAAPFPKVNFNEKLYNEFNEFITNSLSDGYVAELKAKWELKKNLDDIKKESFDFSGENGQIDVAICTQLPPYCTIINGEYSGMDIELFDKFCSTYGYTPNYEDMNIDSLILSLNSGKVDLGIGYLTWTEEREQTMTFSEVYNTDLLTFWYKDDNDAATAGSSSSEQKLIQGDGFFENIINSFANQVYKTFIVDNRWQLILNGLIATIIITFFSIIFGCLLGLLLAKLRIERGKWFNKFANAYIAIFQGTPMLVVLLILYYVIFGATDIDAIIVAIIAFSLNSAAYICEAIKSGIESVDKGQNEAALSLGYTSAKAFRKFVFPQAAANFVPTVRGLAIALLKDTSIVGYIAVMDLTKTADLIRSRTYDALFPLLTVAVIYFLLAYALRKIFELIEKRL